VRESGVKEGGMREGGTREGDVEVGGIKYTTVYNRQVLFMMVNFARNIVSQ